MTRQEYELRRNVLRDRQEQLRAELRTLGETSDDGGLQTNKFREIDELQAKVVDLARRARKPGR